MARLGFKAAAAMALLLAGAGTPALAGDRAQLSVIGYSHEAELFAFEEFGVQDGSGLPYSNIFIVDLATDQWVHGSPFRAQTGEDGDSTMFEVRAEAREAADAAIAEFGVSEPAQVLALLGDGVPDAGGKSLQFKMPGYSGPGETTGPKLTLDLETFPAKAAEDCESLLAMSAKGYVLSLKGQGQPRELHRDTKLPKSRGCPLDYRLYAVYAPLDSDGGRVAIISSYPFGFEGPDRRFLAVPID